MGHNACKEQQCEGASSQRQRNALVTGLGWLQHHVHLGHDCHSDEGQEPSILSIFWLQFKHRIPAGWGPSLPPLLPSWLHLPPLPLQGLPSLEEPLHLAEEAGGHSSFPGRNSLLGGGKTPWEIDLLLFRWERLRMILWKLKLMMARLSISIESDHHLWWLPLRIWNSMFFMTGWVVSAGEGCPGDGGERAEGEWLLETPLKLRQSWWNSMRSSLTHF